MPDLVLGILAARDVTVPQWIIFAGPHIWLGTLGTLLLFIVAVHEAERLGWAKSTALGLLGLAADGLVQFIFIR